MWILLSIDRVVPLPCSLVAKLPARHMGLVHCEPLSTHCAPLSSRLVPTAVKLVITEAVHGLCVDLQTPCAWCVQVAGTGDQTHVSIGPEQVRKLLTRCTFPQEQLSVKVTAPISY